MPNSNRQRRAPGLPVTSLIEHLCYITSRWWVQDRRDFVAASHPNTLSTQDAAELCSVSQRTFLRWLEAGVVPHASADAIACRLGTHVLLIWPDYHHLADEECLYA